MSEKIVYQWRGVWNPGGPGWYEWFGGDDGLPPRDLTEADVAGFSEAQLAKLHSPAGRRLYHPVTGTQPVFGRLGSQKSRREAGSGPAEPGG